MKGYVLPLLVISVTNLLGVRGFNLSNYRLPTNTYPVEYYLTLDLTKPELDTYHAQSWIVMNVTEEDTYDFTFSVNPEYVNLTSLELEAYTVTFICHLAESNNVTQLMGVSCMYDMFENDTTSIVMNYRANYSTDEPRGLIKKNFTINDTDNWVIYTQFEPTSFRKVFPSFDEPSFKAPMRLFVEHHLNLTVISNMEALDTFQTNHFLQSTSFKDTPKMSTYLLAVVAGPNDTWSEYYSPQNENHSFSIFAQKIFEENLSVAMENGPKLLDLIGTWTGLPYESLGNPKMTFAALPGPGGAMENWGLVVFAEQIIIDEGSKTTEKTLESSLKIMAHELSHQWFGDYVTLNWWSELWLNEGFATYFQYYFGHLLSEDLGLDKTFVIENLQTALEADGADTIPLSNDDANVNSEQEATDGLNKYSKITYAKGASILRMIRYTLGDDVFQKAIQNYLQEHALGNVRASDFIQQLQSALSTDTQQPDLSTYLHAWIYQPGYPVLKTSFSSDESENVTITINAYKFNTTEESIWYIPFTYVSSDNPEKVETVWIEPGKSFNYTLTSSANSWSVINPDARGFYRVEYDSESVSRIINVLNNSLTYANISVLSRAQILDDIFAFAIVNNGTYETALSVGSYLRYETDYHPWYVFLNEIELLLDTVQDTDQIEYIKTEVLALVESQLVIPQGQSSKNLSHTEILKRNLLLHWACKLNQSDAIEYVKGQYSSFKNNTDSIDTDFRDVIICHGIVNSDNSTEEMNEMVELFQATVNPQKKYDVVKGLTCAENGHLFASYLKSASAENLPIGKQFWADTVHALKERCAKDSLSSLSCLDLYKL
ncbi:membrane alanyl aminopeptidase-like [Anthonomus grandis grandis]|uniref:membrane alanyl aminopeptidase-like n=1 Tax=Anthonomus grandis grandis TaxID=2921223 RepID=UPI002165B87F|nr:membrane alanyl aminopeptidase-like [Anthonomus grandis grandis]